MSLPTVLVGVVRYARRGVLSDRCALTGPLGPMAAGSVVGVAGGLLMGIVPAALLKVALGLILNVSAVRMFAGARAHAPVTVTAR